MKDGIILPFSHSSQAWWVLKLLKMKSTPHDYTGTSFFVPACWSALWEDNEKKWESSSLTMNHYEHNSQDYFHVFDNSLPSKAITSLIGSDLRIIH
jgi:hypothetical protein